MAIAFAGRSAQETFRLWQELTFSLRHGNDGFVPISSGQHQERPGPSNPIQNMNEWQEFGSGDGGLNGRVWVLPAGGAEFRRWSMSGHSRMLWPTYVRLSCQCDNIFK